MIKHEYSIYQNWAVRISGSMFTSKDIDNEVNLTSETDRCTYRQPYTNKRFQLKAY